MKKLTPVLLLAAVLLSACEKPTPAVTAATIGNSERTTAICWSDDAKVPVGSDCKINQSLIKSMEVIPGEFVGFSVDKEIAESGWVVFVNGSQVTQRLESKYFRFDTAENSFSKGPLEVEIYALTSEQKARGVWGFTLTSK